MINISSVSRRISRPLHALPLALALLAAGCQPAGGPPPFPPPVVSVITVETKDVPVTYEYVAQTAGYREVEVRARVNGILLKRNFAEGAVVKKGDSLFTIDPEPFRAAYARTEADLAVAEARLAQAKREAARLRPVLESKAVSQKELDDAVSAEQVAEAEVQERPRAPQRGAAQSRITPVSNRRSPAPRAAPWPPRERSCPDPACC